MALDTIVILMNGRPHVIWPPAADAAWIAGEPANDNIDDLAPIVEHIAPASDWEPTMAHASKNCCGARS